MVKTNKKTNISRNKKVSRNKNNMNSKNSKNSKKTYSSLYGGAAAVPLQAEIIPPLVGIPNFFEKQEGLGCGRHSLNNLLQNTFFIKGNVDDPAYTELEAKQIGKIISSAPPNQFNLRRFCKYLATEIKENYGSYCPVDENYDVVVLQSALQYCGFEIETIHDRITFINDNTDNNNGVIGYIINYGA